jgi:hypothetical protein
MRRRASSSQEEPRGTYPFSVRAGGRLRARCASSRSSSARCARRLRILQPLCQALDGGLQAAQRAADHHALTAAA